MTALLPLVFGIAAPAQAPTSQSTRYVQVVDKAQATVLLSNLQQHFTGQPAAVSVATAPAGLTVTVTYGGASSIPSTPGLYPVVATINDPNYMGSATGTLSIIGASVVTLTSNASVMLGSPFSMTANVSATGGTPTGQVTFQDGVRVLGSSALSDDRAVVTTSALSVGSHSLSATYAGDTLNPSAISNTVPIMVLDYGVTAKPATHVLSFRGSAGFAVAITPTAGDTLPVPVTLSMSGLPTGVIAALSPAQWVQGATNTWTIPANTTLSNMNILCTRSSSAKQNGTRSAPRGALFALLLVPILVRKRLSCAASHRMTHLGLVCVGSLLALLSLNGCTMQSPLEINAITVNVSAGLLQHSIKLVLDVQSR